ncbi:MAG: ABC transporter permease subunit [Bdellovibrionaceae bacterium]|nr:ABC transporter permease subunit [Pseudobdellovibrionaceae bacterium]NUM58202.1 ABC transporter permease subunit [Pseudobdellovibrionaceae bacterium]
MFFNRIFPPLLAFIVYFFGLEFLAFKGIIDTQLFPPLSLLIQTFFSEENTFQIALKETFIHSALSLVASFTLGLSLSLLFSLFSYLKRMIFPYAIFFQTVPIIAIAPLLVIYLGYGTPTILSSAIFVSIFPIIANSLIGLDSTKKELLDLFKVYDVSAAKTLFYLKLPAAYPYIYAGLKISSGLAVIGVVAGEFVAGSGLGNLIDTARTQQRIDMVYVCLILLAGIGLFFLLVLRFINFIIHLKRPFNLDYKE